VELVVERVAATFSYWDAVFNMAVPFKGRDTYTFLVRVGEVFL
jgi:hypothetical protein